MKDLDIKDIWKQGDTKNANAFSEPQIEEMIRKGSDSLVNRFIKTLKGELWVNLVILTSLSLVLLYSKQWVVGGGMVLLDFLFFLYYQDLIKNLKKEEIDTSVLDYLYTVQRMMKKFILHYKIASFVLAVLIVAAVFYLDGNEFYAIKYAADPRSFIIGLVAGILFAVPFTLYMIHLLYGKKAKKLAHMICSLEKEEA